MMIPTIWMMIPMTKMAGLTIKACQTTKGVVQSVSNTNFNNEV